MAEPTRKQIEERVEALQREVNAQPSQPADMICEVVGGVVADALATGDVTERLRAAGWALVHVGDGSCPQRPQAWAEEALNLMDPGWIDPLGLVEELWRDAWTAGRQAGAAAG